MIRTVICDDEKAALHIIQYFIENENLPIQIVGMAENGREALELIKREKPDLAFLDIHMPYLNGFEVIQQIEGVKVIIITAYDSFAYAQRALRMNVCDIISKPIELDQLQPGRSAGRSDGILQTIRRSIPCWPISIPTMGKISTWRIWRKRLSVQRAISPAFLKSIWGRRSSLIFTG